MKTSMYAICNSTYSPPIYAVCKIPRHLIATAIEGFAHVDEFSVNEWESDNEILIHCHRGYIGVDSYCKGEVCVPAMDTIFNDLDKRIVDLEHRVGAIDGKNIYIAGNSKQQCLEVIRKISTSLSDNVERYICEVV